VMCTDRTPAYIVPISSWLYTSSLGCFSFSFFLFTQIFTLFYSWDLVFRLG